MLGYIRRLDDLLPCSSVTTEIKLTYTRDALDGGTKPAKSLLKSSRKLFEASRCRKRIRSSGQGVYLRSCGIRKLWQSSRRT